MNKKKIMTALMMKTGELPLIPEIDRELFNELATAPFDVAFMALNDAVVSLDNKKWSAAAVNATFCALLSGRFMASHPERAKRLAWLASVVAIHAGMRKKLPIPKPGRAARLSGFSGVAGHLPGSTYVPDLMPNIPLFGLGNAMPVPARATLAMRELERAEAALVTQNAGDAAVAAQNAIELVVDLPNAPIAMDITARAQTVIAEAEVMEPRSMLLRRHEFTPPGEND